MKNAVFWDVALCRSCVNRRFGGTYRLHLPTAATCSRWFLPRGFFYPENGGDTFLRNVGSHNIYTAPHQGRRHSSYSQHVSTYKVMIRCFKIINYKGGNCCETIWYQMKCSRMLQYNIMKKCYRGKLRTCIACHCPPLWSNGMQRWYDRNSLQIRKSKQRNKEKWSVWRK
jgi:hypothetical protein